MENTRELCVQEKQTKHLILLVGEKKKSSQNHESSCLYMTEAMESTACFPMNPRKQEFMFIVKIN